MTREQFVLRWRNTVAGGFMFGWCEDEKLGPVGKFEKMQRIPAEVEKLLAAMYDSLQLVPVPPANGVKR